MLLLDIILAIVLFFKSMGFGKTDITLTDGTPEAIVQLCNAFRRNFC